MATEMAIVVALAMSTVIAVEGVMVTMCISNSKKFKQSNNNKAMTTTHLYSCVYIYIYRERERETSKTFSYAFKVMQKSHHGWSFGFGELCIRHVCLGFGAGSI